MKTLEHLLSPITIRSLDDSQPAGDAPHGNSPRQSRQHRQ